MCIKKSALNLALVSILASASAFAAPTNLVTNGSFELNGGVGQIAGGVSYATGWTTPTTALDGYSVPFNFIVDSNADSTGFPSIFSPSANTNIFVWGPNRGINNGFTGSPDGGYFLGGDADYARAPVEQTINGLTPGQEYALSFYWAQSQFTDATGATTSGWNVNFGGESTDTGFPVLASQGFSGWNSFSHTFTASSSSQLLSFLASGGPAGLPPFALLDGVSLTEVTNTPSEVPLPGGLLLMLSGLTGLVAFGKKRVAA